MRSTAAVTNQRRVLCVFPRYAPSFGTFSHAYKLMPGVCAFMPPQGLLLIAAYLPQTWTVRFADENITPATAADFEWANVVLVSGMHIQAPQIRDIARRARDAGKVVVLGGPSVSASPEMYPEMDYLHLGELGDGTDQLIAALDRSVAPPGSQIQFKTEERLPLHEFPIPAYDLVPLRRYLMLTLQFSSGCPYRCEFCDIPGLYGRQPRLKTPVQITAELDAMRRQPHPPAVYFVDDNFIGNRKAAREMLPHLIAWQRKHSYPLDFACEATLNIAKQTEILELMREARFLSVFVGIETPEAGALKVMRKEHNNAVPMMESIRTLNNYGMEIISGIILGLDTDTPDTEARLKEFVDLSSIPTLTMNLLQALPKTPLWDRLAKDQRIDPDPKRESNVRFLRPYDEVIGIWRRCIDHAYAPDRLFARFAHQIDATYPNRFAQPVRGQLTWNNLKFAAGFAVRSLFYIGIRSDYRRQYWRTVRKALARGQIDSAFAIGFIAHHLIEFSREALRGEQNASFYSARTQDPAPTPQDTAALRKSA